MTRGSKKKYVYVKLPNNKYIKVRVMLQGREKPVVEATMDPSKIIIVGKPTSKVPYGYMVFEFDDLPLEVQEKIRSGL